MAPAPSAVPARSLVETPAVAPMLFPRWRYGWVFAAVWLLFLVEPFEDALGNPDRALAVLGTASVVVFGLAYVLLWRRWQQGRSTGTLGASPREATFGIALLLALGAAVVPAAGASAANTLVFVCAYAAFAVSLRVAGVIVVLVTGGLLVAARLVPGWGGVTGTAAGTVLASVAVYGVSRMISRGRELAVAQQDLARLAVAEERSRFSRDLHDLLGHSLTVITLKAELAGRLMDLDPARAAAEVADVERLARTALTDVRAALEGFREVTLATELAGARQALAAAGIEADLPGAVDEVPGELAELFGWVVREGVTNVVRHSGARHCRVELTAASVAVSDDGTGPRPGAGDGHGLSGLADRARSAGGTLTVGRSAEGGFRVEVAVGQP
ncbi:sensor histidine kinase [Kineococcus rubinsiae]|uniref:sensor histidine kinase n=1 Tax=Kineococcus rubinsiae TaxID=2609562 RepID=UPI00142F81FE|nr:histidine kinase [Kineococcus rubinsiae]NIZ91052.1 sensor histidine kinase [Kineococcus rubinsiae]